MKTVNKNNITYWYDEALLQEPIEQVFEPDFWQSQDKVIGSAQGRGTTWFVQTQTVEAALRHYRRGGLFGKMVKDQYWFSGWEQTRSYQEYKLLHTLIAAGVNVPSPIAARAVKVGPYYRADLLSEKIANARDLVAILQEKPLPESMYQKIGQEIRKMHDAQVNHTDLNIHNILIDEQDEVWIIDFDKCRVEPGDEWKSQNYARLRRSFEKEVGRFNIHFKDSEFTHIINHEMC
ncbi:3-deoxy-D-manno-octulosonic acid kinase [Vibrio sp. 10N.286.49.C2]|uniref:3-deoxy-D-manno-octulosonic acid kinase n=1 Tax=unclassified Vibrio TaxID=2614977 RepID=UPI000C839F0C|nr:MULTISPECIES: 3-deoxy-D-manno-octulosonic acid kinase [unclassified Vibrio]PMH34507.1 3-deoxy-D-manno-octulosonic acid kinase [Vibrio sp. 10N.286.49.C2]PMH46992.1 3-deoxy-D-manno-octulosonic acid kinase [Vibrio sp. 10N.286.49.B1]